MPCKHPDIRKFDGIRCCLACGETEFESLKPAPATQWQASSSTTQYQYSRLNYKLGQEIRLVVILPGEDPDIIRCEVVHVNLEDNPAYEAVSYTWATEEGDDSKSKVIYLPNNESIEVTTNCELALRQLRRSEDVRRLWVDAICINQSNINERNHQVGLMDKIYSQALRVNICIQDVCSAYDYAELFRDIRENCYRNCKERGYNHVALKTCRTIKRLLSLRYFRRVWVIQEVALAKAVYLHVNNNTLPLSSLTLKRIRLLCKQYRITVPGVLSWVPGQECKVDVVSCLRAGVHCQSSDPRDKVFALLSLMEPFSRSLIPVDYSLDIYSVYANVLIAVVASRRNLDVLNYVELPLSEQNHASALTVEAFQTYLADPRSTPTSNRPVPRRLYVQFQKDRIGPWSSSIDVNMSASSGKPFQLLNNTVTLEKLCFSTKPSILPRCRTMAHYIDTIQDVPSSHCHVCNLSHHPIGYYRSDDNIAYKIRPYDWCYMAQHYPPPLQAYRLARHVSHYPFDIWREDYGWILEAFEMRHNTAQVVDASSPLTPDEVNMRDFQSFTREMVRSRERCVMFPSHYSVGFAQKGFMPGDEIFAIDGARTPFILRKTGPHSYRIVSECYLWAALELDYWNPGTMKGRRRLSSNSPRPVQTRMIEIY